MNLSSESSLNASRFQSAQSPQPILQAVIKRDEIQIPTKITRLNQTLILKTHTNYLHVISSQYP
jgi:hypothetical protein